MLAWLRRKYQQWREKRVIKHYTFWGLCYGEECSYVAMGNSVTYEYAQAQFEKWERLYIGLGYAPVPHHIWQIQGGYEYNEEKLQALLRRTEIPRTDQRIAFYAN